MSETFASTLLLRRLRARLADQQRYLVYRLDLAAPLPALPVPGVAVEFRVNCPEATPILLSSDPQYGLEPRLVREVPEQLAAGEVCVSGWVEGRMAYYGWAQFRERKLARRTCLPIGKGWAFIYRCFTRADFRGQRIYPAALQFTCRWLAGHGYERVFIDHHASNEASARGIRMAGWQPLGEYRVRKFLWLKWATFNESLRREITGL